jgi:hypothetical protein
MEYLLETISDMYEYLSYAVFWEMVEVYIVYPHKVMPERKSLNPS